MGNAKAECCGRKFSAVSEVDSGTDGAQINSKDRYGQSRRDILLKGTTLHL